MNLFFLLCTLVFRAGPRIIPGSIFVHLKSCFLVIYGQLPCNIPLLMFLSGAQWALMMIFFFLSSAHQRWKQFSNYGRPLLQLETLVPFFCAGECHGEKWKHVENKTRNSWRCHAVLCECCIRNKRINNKGVFISLNFNCNFSFF